MISFLIITGPTHDVGEFFESRLALSHSSLHHGATQSAASFFHSMPRGDLTGNHINSSSHLSSRPAPILLDLDQDRDVGDDGNNKAASTSPFGVKRDHGIGIGGLGKAGEPRGVNHFATERQRREFLNEKYQTLRSLVPNPTKVRNGCSNLHPNLFNLTTWGPKKYIDCDIRWQTLFSTRSYL